MTTTALFDEGMRNADAVKLEMLAVWWYTSRPCESVPMEGILEGPISRLFILPMQRLPGNLVRYKPRQ